MQPSTSSNFLALLNSTGSVEFTGFCQRLRDIQPAETTPGSALRGLVATKVDGIAGLSLHFNALQLHDTDKIAYKTSTTTSYANRFSLFTMRALVEQSHRHTPPKGVWTPTDWQALSRYCCRTGRHSRYIRNWREHFPGRFNKHSPAAVECHMTMSLAGPVADIDRVSRRIPNRSASIFRPQIR